MKDALKILIGLIIISSSYGTENKGFRLEKSTMIPMRDGIRLSTDLYFPEDAKGKLPTVLIRTVYNKNGTLDWNKAYRRLVNNGYVVAIQDIRGRYESEGNYIVATQRREDGSDTLDWLAAQTWSNQKIGTAGCSYLGETQVVMAATNHPKHTAAIPMSAASGYYAPGRAWQSFSGGVFELAQTAGWFVSNGSQIFYGPPDHIDRGEWFRTPEAELFQMAPEVDFAHYLTLLPTLPTATLLDRTKAPPTEYKQWVTSAPDGEFYRNKDLAKADDPFNVPALFFDNWYDYGPSITLEMFERFQNNAQSDDAKNNQFVVIGPGTHCDFRETTEDFMVGERNLGNAYFDYTELQLRWYDYWLKDDKNALGAMPKVQYYLMGKNEWRSSEHWPLANTLYQPWYLHSKSNAQSRLGDGQLKLSKSNPNKSSTLIYDPINPAPSLGGHTCCTGSDKEAGAYDQSEIELRNDILVYSSEVLNRDIEVTGTIKAVLYVSSSALDTDFTVKLVDVYPDGKAYNIQEGAVRMRYRNSLSQAELMTPGDIYKVEVDLNATSNYFAKGHRIRIEISSSNFPRWERNLNTGGNNYDETESITANNTIYHSDTYPSHIVLPVIKNQ
jgi:putative CocE/NonD family hydrolase